MNIRCRAISTGLSRSSVSGMRNNASSRRTRRLDLKQMRESMVQLRVVLADDHPFVLLGVRSAFSAHQDILIVGEAANPTALIHLLQTVACDVVVTDLTMPETAGTVEDGVRLLKRIRSGWPALHVIVLTSVTNAAILRAVISDDAVSMLNKTEPLDELIVAVRRAHTGCRFVSRSVRCC